MSRGKIGGGLGLIGGAGLGALLMYLFDPEQGEQRRDELAKTTSKVLDRAGGQLSATWDDVAGYARDLGDRISQQTSQLSKSVGKGASSAASTASDRASDYASQAGDYASTLGSQLADQARRLGKLIASKASDASDAAGDYASRGRGYAKDYAARARDAADDLADRYGHESHGMGAAGYTLSGAGLLALAAGAYFLFEPQNGPRLRGQIVAKSQEYLQEIGEAFRTTGGYVRQQYETTVHDLRERISGRQGQGSAERSLSLQGGGESDAGEMATDAGFQRDEENIGSGIAGSQVHWPLDTNQTTRLVLGVAGGALGFYGATRRDWAGLGVGVLGLGLVGAGLMKYDYETLGHNLADRAGDLSGRAGDLAGRVGQLANADALRNVAGKAKEYVGSMSDRLTSSAGPTTFHRTLDINAPVQRVFEFWNNYENFPSFMSNLTEVRDLGNGRSHWVAKGPAGSTVSWDASMTQYVTNEVMSWESVEGSTVQNTGSVKFRDNGNGGTTVDIDLSYTPPAGALGHAVARLFGADPGSEMDEDLGKIKERLESGQTQNA